MINKHYDKNGIEKKRKIRKKKYTELTFISL